MKFTSQQYAQALYGAVEQTSPKDHDKVLDSFVKLLVQNGDLSKYEEVMAEYKILDLESRGIKKAEVTVAKDVEFNMHLIDELNKIVGTKLEITKKIDESIIGGVIVKVDDTLIDASVKTQLSDLNNELKS